MLCRRCNKELPEGHGNICPFCATRQDTYILPRGTEKPKKKTNRGGLLSMISVALVVAIVCVLIPLLREQNKRGLLAEIQEIVDSNDPADGEILSAKIAAFKKSYPDNKEDHERLDKMLNEFLGLDEDFDPTGPSPSESELLRKEIERLISEARSSVIDILSLSLSGPTFEDGYALTIKWKNASKKNVSEVLVTVGAYDAGGNPVTCSVRGKSEGYLRMTELTAAGAEASGSFLNVWYASGIERVKILNIQIVYADGTKTYLPQEVCSALWGDIG